MQPTQTEADKLQLDKVQFKVIPDREFYTESGYMQHVLNVVSQNGDAVIKAFNTQDKAKINGGIPLGGIETVSLRNIQAAKAKTGDGQGLSGISSFLRIVDEDGETEEYELMIQPHYNSSNIAKAKGVGETQLSTENAWLALNPDMFYVGEDENGNEIWPINFPAVSLNNPGVEVEVTLERDGTVRWPAESKRKLAANAGESQLFYVTPMYRCPINDPTCIDRPLPPPPPDDGGDDDDGGFTPPPGWYLGLKTLRINHTGDGDGAGEITMHFQQTDNYYSKFSKDWNYAFDTREYFHTSQPWGIKYKENLAFGTWYETPDVNFAGVDYQFMNMPSSAKFPVNSNEIWYKGRLDYFPLVPLTANSYRLIVTEQDKNYNEFSARRTDTRIKDVWTFDMRDKNYDLLTTKLSADSHHWGNSDEVMLRSGVRRVNYFNVVTRLSPGTDTYVAQSGGFKYVFVELYRP